MDNSKNDGWNRPVELITDFSDYYDRGLFDGEGKSLHYPRYASNDLLRHEALALLMDKGFPTPLHGLVRNMPRKIDLVAVYTDDTGYLRGERCDVMPRSDALAERPDSFAVEYKGKIGSPSISYREICVGECGWTLRYMSGHLWASNQDDVAVTVVNQLAPRWDERFGVPIYALDYIDTYDYGIDRRTWYNNRCDTRFYFDLRLYPKIEGTPVVDELTAKNAASLVREALARLHGFDADHNKELTIPRRASYTKVNDYE